MNFNIFARETQEVKNKIVKKLYYKENDIQQVALIPPSCKQKIIDELAKFNITEDFIYPDMDNVSNEINTNYTKENSK